LLVASCSLLVAGRSMFAAVAIKLGGLLLVAS
jgi:hypothetical protein